MLPILQLTLLSILLLGSNALPSTQPANNLHISLSQPPANLSALENRHGIVCPGNLGPVYMHDYFTVRDSLPHGIGLFSDHSTDPNFKTPYESLATGTCQVKVEQVLGRQSEIASWEEIRDLATAIIGACQYRSEPNVSGGGYGWIEYGGVVKGMKVTVQHPGAGVSVE